MAKKEGTRALTAQRVWQAVKRGSLKVKPIPGTRMLKVTGGRIRLTWGEKDEKRHHRVRLKDIYLNPRWIPLPSWYLASKKVTGLSEKNLAARGLIQLDGKYYLLIYQQLTDLFSLLRQIKEHILPQYGKEEENLWSLFGKIDQREVLGLTRSPAELRKAILGRVDSIGIIRTHLAGRGQAVESRIGILRRLQDNLRGALAMYLELVPESKNEESVVGTVRGLSASLKGLADRLQPFLNERLFALGARWARYHIGKAASNLTVRRFGEARTHLQKAIAHLKWPEEG